MFHSLKSMMAKRLIKIPGWNRDIRLEAKKKLRNLHLDLGLPREVNDPVMLESMHAGIFRNSGTWLDLHVAYKRHKLKMLYLVLLNPKFNIIRYSSVYHTNSFAMYSEISNRIMIPNIFFSSGYPSYQSGAPESILYATVGTILGHEIGHALFFSGYAMNASGVPQMWWNPWETPEFYHRVMEPLIREYDAWKFPVPFQSRLISVRGKATLYENVSDFVGVSLAYLTWKELHSHRPHQLLPGFSSQVTADQVYFIAMAQIYTGFSTVDGNVAYVGSEDDPERYPPDAARVMVPLRHSSHFAQAFHCPVHGPPQQEKRMCLPESHRIQFLE
jgi:predicted metalloendopeptidase